MKPQRHRRTQSNSEVDFKNALNQKSDPLTQIELQELMDHHQLPSTQRTQSALRQSDQNKQVIVDNLDEEVQILTEKAQCGLNFGKKMRNVSSIINAQLFQIPEQNDLISSTQQSEEDMKKVLHKKKNSQKENIQPNLIQQIQKITQTKKMSFTNELQKKQPNQSNLSSCFRTPEQMTSMKKKSEKSPLNSGRGGNQQNLFNILKQDRKQVDETQNLEDRLKKIEGDISFLKQKQNSFESVNNQIEQQLNKIMSQNAKQQEVNKESYKKLEQLEVITRRNEECLSFLKQILQQQQNGRYEGDRINRKGYLQ